MEELLVYLKENLIKFELVTESSVKIDVYSYQLVLPNEDGNIFDENFVLITDFTSCDRYIFKFGGQWYWINKDCIEKPVLNKAKYLGFANTGFQSFPFIGIHGGFEILSGSRNYDDWCKKAKFLEIDTLGICELNTLAGTLKFQNSCNRVGIKSIIGASYAIYRPESDTRYNIKLYVKDSNGWSNLLKIHTEVKVRNPGFIFEDKFLEIVNQSDSGLFLILDPKSIDFDNLFPLNLNDFYFQFECVEYIEDERDKWYLLNLQKFVKLYKVKPKHCQPILIQDAYYLDKDDFIVKQIMSKISSSYDYAAVNQYFKSFEEQIIEFNKLFGDEDLMYDMLQVAFENLNNLCSLCNFKIDTSERHLPKFELTPEQIAFYADKENLFWSLVNKGVDEKVDESEIDIYLERVEEELDVILFGDVLDYFLILWDIIEWCRRNDILVGFGRGSAGGSLIAYLLGITQIDPIKFGLLFSRFLNKGRIQVTLPDIDVDFCSSRRDDVKKYMEDRFGVTQVCSVGTYTNLKIRSAIKDISKQFNVPFEEVNSVTLLLGDDDLELHELFRLGVQYKSIRDFINKYPEVINKLSLIQGQPKAESIHACATLVLPSEKEMYDWIPVKHILKDSNQIVVTEWEGDELADAGFLKEDILGVSELDKLYDITKNINNYFQEDIVDIYTIPLNDYDVFEYFKKGWNSDVFHFGSPGLTGYCKELKPESIEDLIAGISLFRPGAMENNFHNEYVLRKRGDREIQYFIGSEEILSKTYGVFVYQEQIMKLCQVLGGLSLVEADDVRKAMVKKKYEALHQYKERFLSFYVENFNVTQEYADNVWDAIDKASTYLFNRSHATAYTITGYVGQWLKVHFPIFFWEVALSYASKKQDKDVRIPRYLSEINNTGQIKISPVDINKSTSDFSSDIEGNKILFSFNSVKFVGESAINEIISLRSERGQYFSFEEFYHRHNFKGSKVNKRVIENLIFSGAFDEIEGITYISDRSKLFHQLKDFAKIKDPIELPKTDYEWTLKQKEVCGVGIFDYENLCSQLNSDNPFVEGWRIFDTDLERVPCRTGGVVIEIIEKSGKRGDYCNIIVENNFDIFEIKFWPEQYTDWKEVLLSSKGHILLLTGVIGWDTYKKSNVVYADEQTEVKIL